MVELDVYLESLTPGQAAVVIASAARRVFSLLEQDERRAIITEMLGDPGDDKVAGMVHL